MRLAVIPLLFALLGCSAKGEDSITLCCEKRWWGSTERTFRTQADLDRYIETERLKSLQVAKSLPFDYVACSTEVLAFELAEGQHSPDDLVYLSVFSEEPDVSAIDQLRRQRTNTHPQSAIPPSPDGINSSPGWRYNLYSMHGQRFRRGYEAYVSYYCGALCAGQYRYRLERKGNSCKVLSREQFGPVS